MSFGSGLYMRFVSHCYVCELIPNEFLMNLVINWNLIYKFLSAYLSSKQNLHMTDGTEHVLASISFSLPKKKGKTYSQTKKGKYEKRKGKWRGKAKERNMLSPTLSSFAQLQFKSFSSFHVLLSPLIQSTLPFRYAYLLFSCLGHFKLIELSKKTS